MDGLTLSTVRGLFWMSLGTGAQAALQLLVLIILARLLTPADFGIVSAALVVLGFTTIFSQLGVGPAVVQRTNLETRHLRTAFTFSLLFGVALAGLVWLLAPEVSSFFRIDGLTPVVKTMSVILFLQGASVVAESLLQRELLFRQLACIEMAAMTAGFAAVGVTMALMGFGVWALVGAYLAQTVLKMLILLKVKPHPKKPLLERHALKDLLWFGGGFTLARIGNYVAGQGDNLVVGRWLGADALGFYGRATQLMVAPAMIVGEVLDRVLFPAMAQVQSDTERLQLAFRRGIALIAIIILPLSAVLFFLAPEFIYVLLGPGWDAAVAPFQILALGMLFRTSYKMSDTLTRAIGAVYRRAWRQGIYAVLVVGGAYVGQFGGLPGVALGLFFAITINFIFMAQLSLQLAQLSWRDFWAAHVPALALAAVSGIEAWGLASLLRNWEYPPLTVLVTSSACVLLTALLLMRYSPVRFLGQDGLWMLKTLLAHFAAR